MLPNPFQMAFDDILNNILTDFQNTFPNVDVSKGTLAFMKAAGYSSSLWGLYKFQSWIANQIFPDTADESWLDHHGWVFGLTPNAGETASQFLARLLDNIQEPPAGGNKNDYETWAELVPGVADAVCIPLGQGLGTVDLVVLADAEVTGSQIPTPELLTTVRNYIVGICPTDVQYLRVLAPSVVAQNVTMTVTGASSAQKTQAQSDITSYINSLTPGQTLSFGRLTAIAMQDGATDVDITTPPASVTATPYQLIRSGVINVT